MRLQTEDNWTLTLHWFKRAADAGVEPIQSSLGECLRSDESNRSFYTAYEWTFNKRPTRQDFIDVLEQVTWSATSYHFDLIPALKDGTFAFPVVTIGKKGAQVALILNGKTVGKIEIWRQEVFQVKGYTCPILLTSDVMSFLNRRIHNKDYRANAYLHLEDNEHRVLEASLKSAGNYQLTKPDMYSGLHDVLVQGGFLKATKKTKVATA